MPAARARSIADDLPQAAPLVDAYTGLLIVSVVATLIGLVFLLLDYSDYPKDKAPTVRAVTVPVPSAIPAPSAPQAPVQPGPVRAAPGGVQPPPQPGAGQPKAGAPAP
jgi:hypothetical protein